VWPNASRANDTRVEYGIGSARFVKVRMIVEEVTPEELEALMSDEDEDGGDESR